MKILVIGTGGREHALIWKLKQSPQVKKIFCAPGNGGIASLGECIDIKAEDVEGLLKFALKKKIDFTVVGPEAPLALGIVDKFEHRGLRIFGPHQQAARLEASKAFAKEFMHRYHIPTANFRVFEQYEEAELFLKESDFPLVVKADGLAAGKGVMVCATFKEASQAIDQIMRKKIFKEAGNKVVIEECLFGQEVSILAVSDGNDFLILDSAQDHKRIFDDDLGPNTGGMGAYSPAYILSKELHREISTNIIRPVIEGMKKEGNIFKGILYAGLMITGEGPRVLEFNVRFGDPEAQALLPRLKNDLYDVMLASCQGDLHRIRLSWDRKACVCVVMSARGYPAEYEKGKEIKGLEAFLKDEETIVFHAGTTLRQDGTFVSSGGRVLGVTSLGDDIEGAIKRVYNSVEKIKFDGCFFRRDIGAKALRRSMPRAAAGRFRA